MKQTDVTTTTLCMQGCMLEAIAVVKYIVWKLAGYNAMPTGAQTQLDLVNIMQLGMGILC